MQNPSQKKVDSEGAEIVVITRIANFNESNTPTINIYIGAVSQANETTAWACFIKVTDKEVKGRIPIPRSH